MLGFSELLNVDWVDGKHSLCLTGRWWILPVAGPIQCLNSD